MNSPSVPPQRAGDTGQVARGFALYVGLRAQSDDGDEVGDLVRRLTEVLAELAPSAESYAAVALAPGGTGGRDLDVVRLALGEPAALARRRSAPAPHDSTRPGLVIDLTRRRVLLDGTPAPLTFREVELLQFLVLREGRTVTRDELVVGVRAASGSPTPTGAAEPSAASAPDAPNERSIDVHVRRLRVKLGQYRGIVRTVRGSGYRFDRHADVTIVRGLGRSPDMF